MPSQSTSCCCKISALKLFTRFAQRQRQKILLDQRLIDGRGHVDLRFDLVERDVIATTRQQQSTHEVLELPHIVGPRVIPQSVLRRDAESPERQAFRVDKLVDVVGQQFRNILRVLAQWRDSKAQLTQVRDQVASQLARFDLGLKVGANGSDNTRIDLDRPGSTNTREIGRPPERRTAPSLRSVVQIRELIDDQRSARGPFERAGTISSPLLAAEQLFLDIALR